MQYENLVVHVGFHKTGTSYLQQNIFRQANLIEDERLSNILWGLNEEGFYTNPFYNTAKSIRSLLEDNISPNQCNIISDEGLLGHPASSQVNAKQLLETVVLFSKKIIITIRKQDDLIISTYFQYLRNGGNLDFAQFVNQPCARQKFHFSPFVYDYNNYIDYIDSVGDDCLVLPIEYINTDEYYEILSDFCGAKFIHVVQPKYYGGGEKIYYGLRHIRKFFLRRSWTNYSGVINGVDLPIIDRLGKKIFANWTGKMNKSFFTESVDFLSYYKEANKLLDSRVPFDLKSKGYY